jgi:hypothetical protein
MSLFGQIGIGDDDDELVWPTWAVGCMTCGKGQSGKKSVRLAS